MAPATDATRGLALRLLRALSYGCAAFAGGVLMWLGASLAFASSATAATPLAAPARESAGSVHVTGAVSTGVGLRPTDYGVGGDFQQGAEP